MHISARHGSSLPTVVQHWTTKGCILQLNRSRSKLGTSWFTWVSIIIYCVRDQDGDIFPITEAAENNHHSKLSLLVPEVYRAYSSVLGPRMKKVTLKKRIESKAPLYCMLWYQLCQALQLWSRNEMSVDISLLGGGEEIKKKKKEVVKSSQCGLQLIKTALEKTDFFSHRAENIWALIQHNLLPSAIFASALQKETLYTKLFVIVKGFIWCYFISSLFCLLGLTE